MENLFIKIKDGKPFEHPIPESNLRLFYPNMDPENPPEGYARFIRLPMPYLGPLDKEIVTTYMKVGEVYQDVHTIVPMSSEEKKQKIDRVKRMAPFVGWKLDEKTLTWYPPIPMPNDGKKYYWDNTFKIWKELTSKENQE